jgi:hypothetical protein
MEYTQRDLDSLFETTFDEVIGDVWIGSYRYSASKTLRDVDPIAYDQEYLAWLDNELREGNIFEHADGSYHDEEEEGSDDE